MGSYILEVKPGFLERTHAGCEKNVGFKLIAKVWGLATGSANQETEF